MPSDESSTGRHLIRYGGDTFDTVFTRASGCYVYDTTGREILDFTSGQMCATIGHNHPAIVAAVGEAGAKAYHLYSGMIPDVVESLATELAEDWLPGALNRLMFVNTGSESNEAALRMAKLYTGGFEVIAVGGSWHGVTGGAAGVSFASDRHGYGPTRPGVFVVPEPNLYRPPFQNVPAEDAVMEALELGLRMYDMQSVGAPAAIIVEPVLSAAGVLVPPRRYLQRLRDAADERQMLLIFDEAQTAFGRIGDRFGADHFDVEPDIMTMSKTLGGGLPLAAVATTDEIEQVAHERGFTYYTSHVSDPLPATAGLAVLDTIKAEGLIERSVEMGAYLQSGLETLQGEHEVIGDVRGLGLLRGVELVKDRTTKEPNHQLGAETTRRCLDLGLSMNIRRRPERGSVWRMAPPLTVSRAQIDDALEILDKSLSESLAVASR